MPHLHTPPDPHFPPHSLARHGGQELRAELWSRVARPTELSQEGGTRLRMGGTDVAPDGRMGPFGASIGLTDSCISTTNSHFVCHRPSSPNGQLSSDFRHKSPSIFPSSIRTSMMFRRMFASNPSSNVPSTAQHGRTSSVDARRSVGGSRCTS